MASREAILAYVKKSFGTEADYPWRQHPDYAVLRHTENGKWYGLLMTLPAAKLGLEAPGDVEVINLKCDQTLDILINSAPGTVLPAYHMNKKHWITIVLHSGFSDEALYQLIDESHGLTK